MATRRRRGLGKAFTKKPRGCACADGGTPVMVGKFGVRCMNYRRVNGIRRFVHIKTPKTCNPK
jgi:hypothetical protein